MLVMENSLQYLVLPRGEHRLRSGQQVELHAFDLRSTYLQLNWLIDLDPEAKFQLLGHELGRDGSTLFPRAALIGT